MSFNLAKTTKTSNTSNKRILKSNTSTNVVSGFFNDTKIKNAEAKVLINIKDLKYGNQHILNPQVTTIIDDKKKSFSIPFTVPIEYHFDKVEDEMVFKFAINGTSDLLGFLYLEIPHKFKAINSFHLDDWFPIKQIETEDEIALQMQNFVVRVGIDYSATKKLKVDDNFETNLDIKKGFQNIAQNLKKKIKNLHQEIDQYEGGGMNHLKNFEQKMLNKKKSMRKWEKISPSPKKEKGEYKNYMNQLKNKFYQNTKVISKSPQVKSQRITPDQYYPFEEGKLRIKGNGQNDINEKMFRELCLTRKDLIEARQKLNEFEDGLITIDNKKLKEILEKDKNEVFKERENLHLKLNEQNNLFEEEKEKLRKDYQKEKEQLENMKKEMRKVMDDYEKKMEMMDKEKLEIKNVKYEFKVKQNKVQDELKQIEEKKQELKRYEDLLNNKSDDMDDVKKRIMAERNLILKETQDYEYLKGDVLIQKQLLTNEAEVIEDKKKQFEEDCRVRVKDLLMAEENLQSQKKIFLLEKQMLQDEQKKIEDQMKEVNEDKKLMKLEGVRLWKEKTKNQEEIKEFMEWKKMVDSEYKEQQRELESDYDYIDRQLHLIEKNKLEFDNLKGHLEQYETYLENQERIQNEQIQRFYLLQKQFFFKLKSENLDIEELRTFSDKFAVDYEDMERNRAETGKLTTEIEYQKDNFKKTINNITLDVRDITLKDRKKSNLIRKQSRMSRMSVFGQLKNFEMEYLLKIKKDATKIIDNMFIDVCVKKMSTNYQEKEKYIKKLETTIDYLNTNAIISHSDIKAHDKNFDILQKIDKKKSIHEPRQKSPSFGQLTNYFNNKHVFLTEVSNLESQKELILAVCDKTIEDLNISIEETESPEEKNHLEDKIEVVIQCKNIINGIIQFLMKYHLQKIYDDHYLVTNMNIHKVDNLEELRKKYEKKIRLLVDYIKKVKNNSNFFDYNVDNDILVNK